MLRRPAHANRIPRYREEASFEESRGQEPAFENFHARTHHEEAYREASLHEEARIRSLDPTPLSIPGESSSPLSSSEGPAPSGNAGVGLYAFTSR